MPRRLPPEKRRSGDTRIIFQVPPGTDFLGNPSAEIVVVIPIVAVAEDPDALAAHVAELLAANPGWTHLATGDQATLPPTRAKRNAWRWNGTRVVDTPE